jgi:type IV pilus assembly protein PilO
MFGIISKYIDPLLLKVEQLTKVHRIIICSSAFLVLIGCFTWFSFYPKFTDINRLGKEKEDLERKLTIAKRKASQLPKLRKEMQAKEAEFNIAKRALPEEKEIPSLVTEISRAGNDVGLEFLLFQLGSESRKEFYAEIPVSIKVLGTYHNIATFFDKVARLFRVVNITDINMSGRKGVRELNTSCTAITYRFLEPEKKAPPAPKKGKKKG